MLKEIHTMKPFRAGDSGLGIIRLNNLAYPEMSITIGGIGIKPIGFDTYGHPIISASNFDYYKALKANAARSSETFLTEVTYKEKPFCIKRECYDSAEEITKIISDAEEGDLSGLKNFLILRKQASFLKKPLKVFVLFDRYVLNSDGHIYLLKEEPEVGYFSKDVEEVVMEIEDGNIELGAECHLPGSEDVCAICGEHFSLKDVEEMNITENEKCEKVHHKCLQDFTRVVQMQTASQIIDAVYENAPSVQVKVRRIEDGPETENKTWYVYHTAQGDIAITFKTKVIVIEWLENFKPFNMKIFAEENVTKFVRGIHAWSKADAIRYLEMAKKS